MSVNYRSTIGKLSVMYRCVGISTDITIEVPHKIHDPTFCMLHLECFLFSKQSNASMINNNINQNFVYMVITLNTNLFMAYTVHV